MFNFWSIGSFRVHLFFVLVSVIGSMFAVAAEDYDTVIKSKEMVEKVNELEKKLRAEVKEDIAEKRKQALSDLERVLGLHQSSGQKGEALLIENEIVKLKRKMGLPLDGKVMVNSGGGEGEGDNGLDANQYFKFRTDYFFKEEGIIIGSLNFRANQKVRAICKYEGNKKTHIWDWEDMGDHVQIKTGGEFGTIIISERPSSNLKTILIRWGGELKNTLTDANLK